MFRVPSGEFALFVCYQHTEITSSMKYQDSEEPNELVKTLIILKNVSMEFLSL